MNRSLFFVFLIAIVAACQDEDANRAVLKIDPVVQNADGAIFQANLSVLGSQQYDNYGFVWGKNHDLTLSDSVYFFNQSPKEGAFNAAITTDLIPGQIYYVKAFLLKGQVTQFSNNSVKFESTGSSSPLILDFIPKVAMASDTVTITGQNFTTLIQNTKAFIGDTECSVVSATKTTLKIIAPADYFTGSYAIKIQVNGKSTTATEKITLGGPMITDMSPTSGLGGSHMILTGTGFSATPANNTVVIEDFNSTVLKASETSLEIFVPNLSTAGPKKVTVTVNHATNVATTSFTLLGPTITSISPLTGEPGTRVEIIGTNFDPNTVQVSFGDTWHMTDFSSKTPTRLVLYVPRLNSAGTAAIYLTSRNITITADQTFNVIGPEITSFSPAAQSANKEITILGKNFRSETKVFFGYAEAKVTFISSTELKAAVPFDIVGDCDLKVQNFDISFTAADQFKILSQWKTENNFPGTGRTGAVGFAIDNYGYVGLGTDGAKGLGDFWRYDASAQTWTKLNDFPGAARYKPFSFVINGKAYVGGGFIYDGNSVTYPNDFWEYDPNTDQWTQKSDFQRNYTNSNVYGASLGSIGYYVNISSLMAYDPSTDTWDYVSGGSGTFYEWTAAHTIGNKLYCPYSIPSFRRFDPAAKTSDEISGVAFPYNAISFVIDDKIYLASGGPSYVYVPLTNQWTEIGRINVQVYAPAIFVISGTAYVVCGGQDGFSTPSKRVSTFNPNR